MAGVLLRTAGGTLLFVAFLWLVRIDDYRVAGMMLTFPMLNGMGLVAARKHASELGRSMVPVITLNGAMCFLFALALTSSDTARTHPVALTLLAAVLWLVVYAVLESKNVVVPSGAPTAAFVTVCAVGAVTLTYWLWPSCTPVATEPSLRSGGLAGVLESWARIGLFALSLGIVFGFAHVYRHAHAAIGRLAALPLVPLFGLYTVAAVLASDPAALAKLETMRSMVLIGWIIALVYAVALAAFVTRTSYVESGSLRHVAAMIIGWTLCLAAIAVSARLVPALTGCASA